MKKENIKNRKNRHILEENLKKDEAKPFNFTKKKTKGYENNNLLIGDKVKKSSIFSKYALYKSCKIR